MALHWINLKYATHKIEYAINKKGSELGFRGHIFAVPSVFCSEPLVHNSSAGPTSAFPPFARRHIVLRCCDRHLRNRLVEHLEGKTLGEELGHRRKPDEYPAFPPIFNFPLTTRLESPRGPVVYRNSRTGCFFVA